MKLSNKYSMAGLFLVALLAVSGAAAFAQKFTSTANTARPEIKIDLAGAVERGEKSIPVAESGRVNSGEVIDWTITSINNGNAAATSHEAVAQIPAGTSFVSGSAKSEASAAVSYSVDNGKTFSDKPMMAVKQADGSMKNVPAPVASYTQVRYKWDSPLAAENARTATYKVSVK
jgi:uncharacterized repeat protein (TIGR01451 family)